MIEELIKTIDIQVTGKGEKGEPQEVGISFHWSPSNECWLVAYGNRPRYNRKGTGNGATLSFAIKDFLEKQKQFGK